MAITTTKCTVVKALHLGHSNPCHCYHVNHNILEEVLEIKELGVAIMMDNNMKFPSQIAVAIAKANRILAKRSFTQLAT